MSEKKRADALLQECYDQYRIRLFNYCLSRLDSREAADDCVQETFIVFYNKLLDGEEFENPRAFLYRTADNRMRIPLKGVNHIYLAERLIWSEGETIDTRILKLLEHKTEYTGDAPALGRLCGTHGVGDLGQYTMELSTAQPPYLHTLIFTSGESAVIHDKMSEYAMYLLALVDNLEEVAWEAPDGTKGLWDVESLDRYLKNDPLESYALLYGEDLNFPESIKDCGTAGGLAKLEKLLEHPELFNTPIVRNGREATVGYCPDVWAKWE